MISRGKGKIGWENRLDRKVLEWLLGVTSSLLCVHVCECVFVYQSSSDGNLKMMQRLPFGLIFLFELCLEMDKVSEWNWCCRNFMNGAEGRFSRRGAEQGDAVGSALSSRSCHSRELHRQAPAWHKSATSPWDTK